jgi:4-amino-4-deoxy-L-arabinose transferase-like glycosyltransferase
MKTRERVALAAIVILAALLRVGGISHDLYEGYLYHPDTPKQVRAVQMFLGGQYYRHLGLKDYDGYPLLHAHLVEYVIRVAEPVREASCRVLGIPPAETKPLDDSVAIYWLMLAMNALASTVIVLIVFSIGREAFGPAVGWIAALFMAISPVDIVSSHMATGDATTAFFSSLALLYALRVYRLGRMRDYALATAMATFAFAAKYYAATAFFGLALAHIARCGATRPASWFSPPALRRIAVCAVVAVVSLFLAVPELFGHFRAQLFDMWSAMMVSTQRYPEWLKDSTKWQRIMYSMRVNLPDLLRSVTPVALGAVILVVVSRLRRDPRVWILLIGVLLYVFLAVASRGPVNPVYHIAITPPVFILTGFLLAEVWNAGGRRRAAARAATVAALSAACCLLGRDAAREVFFPLQWDTRRLAETWATENVPLSFRIYSGRYTFRWTGEDDRPGADAGGLLLANSALDPTDFGEGAILLKRFRLERSPLTQFRNIDQEIHVFSPGLLRKGFVVPVSQRWPAQAGSPCILDNGAEFVRSEKSVLLGAGQDLSRWLVADRPLEEVWIAIQAVNATVKKSARFGGRRARLVLRGPTSAFLHVSKPRAQWPSGGGLYFYKFEVARVQARTRVTLATRAADAGRILANLGHDAEAAELLARGALDDANPAAAAMALAAARAAGSALPPEQAARLAALAAPVRTVKDNETFFAAFGIHPRYFDLIPFVRLEADDLGANRFRLKPPPFFPADGGARELVATEQLKFRRDGDTYAVWTGPLILDPGRYLVQVMARSPSGVPRQQALRLSVEDPLGNSFVQREVTLPPMDGRAYSAIPFEIDVPPGVAACRIDLRSEEPPDLAIGSIEVRPDVVANVIALGKAIDAAEP